MERFNTVFGENTNFDRTNDIYRHKTTNEENGVPHPQASAPNADLGPLVPIVGIQVSTVVI